MQTTEPLVKQAAIVTRRLPICKDREDGPRRLVETFLAKRSETTRRAYMTDLKDFAAWTETGSPAEAVWYLISQGPGPANEAALNYKAALRGRGLSAGTVNRRLSTLRSILKMARTVGLCNFALEVESERTEAYRDTRGPGEAKVRELIGKLTVRAQRGRRQAKRDLAIVRLLFNRGLRRGEVVSLDLEHYDREGKRLSILGKGRTQREWLDLAETPSVTGALEDWLAERGEAPGPLFVQCDRLSKHRPGDGRLSGVSVWQMLRKFGIRPHALRHSAITLVAKRNGGNLFETMAFSRHKSAEVVTRYVDNLRNDAGKMAALLESIG